jgi:hypothetical protein
MHSMAHPAAAPSSLAGARALLPRLSLPHGACPQRSACNLVLAATRLTAGSATANSPTTTSRRGAPPPRVSDCTGRRRAGGGGGGSTAACDMASTNGTNGTHRESASPALSPMSSVRKKFTLTAADVDVAVTEPHQEEIFTPTDKFSSTALVSSREQVWHWISPPLFPWLVASFTLHSISRQCGIVPFFIFYFCRGGLQIQHVAY